MTQTSIAEPPAAVPTHTRRTTVPAEFLDATDRRAQIRAKRAATARQASGRRRMIDPTTCERDYSESDLEFMQAIQAYKQSSGRSFPTWSEVLEVLKGLGYQKAGC